MPPRNRAARHSLRLILPNDDRVSRYCYRARKRRASSEFQERSTTFERCGMTTRPFRLAMVGGGPGSFIGPVHRMAAELDGAFKLVAGAFSRDPVKSRAAAERYGLPIERAFHDYDAMLDA